jgi:tetraacyldisaccharide 4'-kinase
MKRVHHILSLFHQAGCQVKNALYRIKILHPKKAPLAVVSVGNITFGGSEKTPFVVALVAVLLQKGFKPAVVTRGYKGKWEKSGGIVSDGKIRSGTWVESGDEPFMVSIKYPEIGVFVGVNRLLSCQKAHEMGFQVAILDDGFQHRRLSRDVDIILHDPSEDVPLREPLSSIKRADILLLKKGAGTQTAPIHLDRLQDVDTFYYSVSSEGFYSLDGIEESISNFKGKRILAFCGIARPQRFRSLLERAGMEPIHFISFPDHFPYPPESIKQIIRLSDTHRADVCITTEKDAVKIKDKRAFQVIPIYYLKIGILTDEKLFERIFSELKKERRS